MTLSSLPPIMLEPLVRAALLEDLGRAGDLTSDAIVPKDLQTKTVLSARQQGVVAGLDLAGLAFRLIDQNVEMTVHRPDGSDVAQGEMIASVSGPARAIFTAERTALNFLSHLSGIATATASVVAAVRGHSA
ncbi:nicotinate-nucleotide diphosphorylase (carboxylating), partial [Mesorhizobium sp. M8A.F.Ca.ET.059.01.1.1]